MTFRFLSIFSGRPTMTDLPVRPVGWVQAKIGIGTTPNFLLEYDGYWIKVSSNVSAEALKTIGSASSGATIAQVWTQNLFTVVWENFGEVQLFTSTGAASVRGSTPSADFAANKRIQLPDFRGRVLMGCGRNGLITASPMIGLNTYGGLFNTTLTTEQLPPHRHRLNVSGNPGSVATNVNVASGGPGDLYLESNGGGPYVENTGGGQAFTNLPPYLALDLWISTGAR